MVVRADTRIELRVERRPDGEAHLTGTLRDDLGATLADAPVDVTVWHEGEDDRRWSAHPRTDGRGSFDVVLTSENGWWASATFAGDELHLPTEARQRLDLSLAHVSLTVHVEDRGVLDLDRPSHTVRVGTESAVGGADIGVSLRNELGVVLAEGRTDLSGEVVLTVPSDRLGPPSAGRLIALSTADALRSAAQAEVPIIRLRPTQLALTEVDDDDDAVLRLTGTLSDSSGPRAGEAVGVFGADRHLGTAATDESGHFAFDVTRDAVAGLGGEVEVRARFESDAPWVGGSESAPIVFRVSPPLVDAATWVGVVSLGLVLAALLLLGRRPVPIGERTSDPGLSSVALGERRGPRVGPISGRVLDARTARPVAATLAIGERSASADADGAFVLEPAPGRGVLEVRADGYGKLDVPIQTPHRGEHAGMRIRLVSLRDLAIGPLRPIALRLLPSADLWSVWTHRELLSALRKAGREPPELAALIERVERACYADTPPSLEELEAIQRIATSVEARMAPRAAAR